MTAALLPPTVPPSAPDPALRTFNRTLSAATKGYYLFPVHPGTKLAATDAAHSPDGTRWGCTRDADRIRAWWGPGGLFVDHLIGIATEESGVVLIDQDVKPDPDGNAQDGPGEWAALRPAPYPFPAAVGHSPSGGLHELYRADPKHPVKTCAREVAPGVDTRGMGGMFVLCSDWLPAVSDLPLVPAVVWERAPFVERKPSSFPSVVDRARFAPTDDVEGRVAAFADELAGAGSGHANHLAASIAWKVGGYVGAGQIDRDRAVGILCSAFAGWTWAHPRDHGTMLNTVERQVDLGAARPRPWVAEPTLAEVTAPTRLVPMVRREGPASAPSTAMPTVQSTQSTSASTQSAPTAAWVGGASTAADPYDDDTVEDHAAAPAPQGRRVVLTPLSEIRIRRARWLWAGRVPTGALTLVAGKQGLGKSTIVYDLVAQMTRGELPGEFHGTPRAALICATEDDWSCTIKPRLVAARADVDKVFRVEAHNADDIAVGLVLPDDIGAVEEAARVTDAALLVLDPLTSRLNASLDGHKDGPVRQALEPIVAMSGRIGLASLGLMHLNKGSRADPMDAVMGATAFTAVARSVLIVMPDPDDEDHRRKFVGLAKNNLGRLDLPMLAFHTVGALVETDDPDDDLPAEVGRIEWLGEVDGSIADAMESAGQDEETRTGIADAVRWLGEHLSACGGTADAMSVKDAARKAGFNERMITRARKRAGVQVATIPGTFPRRTEWTLKRGGGLNAETSPDWGSATRPTPQRTPTLQTKISVTSVCSVSTSTDSGDSRDSRVGQDSLSAQGPCPVDTGTRTPPPCPCGRPESLHSRGAWTTCRGGHRWHAFGDRPMTACPQCDPSATVRPRVDDLAQDEDGAA